MTKIILPKSDHVEIEQGADVLVNANQISIAKIMYMLFGQIWVEDLLRPILSELQLDHDRFFKAFWAHVEKVALSE